MTRCWWIVGLACGLAAAARAQDDELFRKLPLRVTAAPGGGVVVVDRGARDGVAVGDLVFFYPREGGAPGGTVTSIDDRQSQVDLHDKTIATLVAGVRGEVLVPKARARAGAPQEPQAQPPDREGPPPPAAEGEHPPWQNPDQEWKQGMPLLAQVKPVRPEDRAQRVTGRFYTVGGLVQNSVDRLRNSYLRSGADVTIENPAGHGGTFRTQAELDLFTNRRKQAGVDLFVQRLSYSLGGDRFTPTRWEVGRFLQHGMPEFGLLDGFELGTRRDDGSRFGASIGWQPKLDDDFTSFVDFQVAAYYLWAADDRERLTFGAGFQKTFHRTDSDRDLLVAKTDYHPGNGWDAHATVWIDFYYGGADNLKNRSVDVTQALASATRRFDDGSGFDLEFRRITFPDLRRSEFAWPVLAAAIADNHYERLALDGWVVQSEHQRVHGQVSLWSDEDDSGVGGEAGFTADDVLFERGSADLTLFGSLGQFVAVGGARIGIGRDTGDGRWDAFYEIANHHNAGFTPDRDDLLQHRMRFSRTFNTDTGWSLSGNAEAVFWDKEWSWGLGMYLQRSF